MSGMHLTYCLMASKLLCFPPSLFHSNRHLLKNFSCSFRPKEYLWEFQSIPLIMYLSLECCVRNHNSPHILSIINFQAIAGKFRVTAPWVEPCWRAARLWAFVDGKVLCSFPGQNSCSYLIRDPLWWLVDARDLSWYSSRALSGFSARSLGTKVLGLKCSSPLVNYLHVKENSVSVKVYDISNWHNSKMELLNLSDLEENVALSLLLLNKKKSSKKVSLVQVRKRKISSVCTYLWRLRKVTSFSHL